MRIAAKTFPALLSLALASSLCAQYPDTLWTRTFGTPYADQGYAVQSTGDGGFVLVGAQWDPNSNGNDIIIIKTDSLGNSIWTAIFGEPYHNDVGHSIRQTTDGGYIVAGYTSSFGAGNPNMVLIKTDPAGAPEWIRTYGGTGTDIGCVVQQTPDRGYVMAGYTNSFGTGFNDVYVVKVDSTGDTLWTAIYGGDEEERGHDIQIINDGGYLVAGRSGSDGDVYVVRISATGDTLWTRSYGSLGRDYANSVQVMDDGGFILTGRAASEPFWDSYALLLRLNEYGDSLWAYQYCQGEGYDVKQIQDKGYVFVGAGDSQIIMICTDSLGNENWSTSYGGPGDEAGVSVVQCPDSGFAFTGWTNSFGAGNYDVYLLRTKPIAGIAVEPEHIASVLRQWQEVEQTLRIFNTGNAELAYHLTESPSAEWLTVQPEVDTIGVGDSMDATLTLHPAGLPIGTYHDTLIITSNDPFRPRLCVQVTLTLMEGSGTSIWIYPSTICLALLQDNSTQLDLTLANAGDLSVCWQLREIPPVGWLSAQPEHDSLLPGASSNVSILIDATGLDQRAYTGTLLFEYSNPFHAPDTIPVSLLVTSGEQVQVYPNPFVPSKGHTVLTFGNLPQSGSIDTYSPSGELVWHHCFHKANGMQLWNGKTDSNGDIASGVYYYVVKSKGGNILAKGKFAVIR